MEAADMKLTTILGTAVAAVCLAACGPTAAAPTVRPSTPTPTIAATPTATPTPVPTRTPTPVPLGIYVTTTCAVPGTAQGASVTFHNVVIGDWLLFGYSDGPQYHFNRSPYMFGPENVGTWPWKIWNDAKAAFIAHGTVTIPACTG